MLSVLFSSMNTAMEGQASVMSQSPELTRIAGGNCGRDDCPTVFITDRGTVAVQGYNIDRPTPAGESVVEIPLNVLKEAVGALGW
jgi:hypothetical protein